MLCRLFVDLLYSSSSKAVGCDALSFVVCVLQKSTPMIR